MSVHEDIYQEKRCVHCDRSIHLPYRSLRSRVHRPGRYYKICQGCCKLINSFNVVIIKKTWRDFCGFWVRDLKYEMVGSISKKDRSDHGGSSWELFQDASDRMYLNIWQIK